MSFLGGWLWVILAIYLFTKKNDLAFWKIIDEVALVTPIGLFFGRIWNYINKELLWYSWYDGLFAVEINDQSYFPSPLLESLLEWLILWIILLLIAKNKLFHWRIASIFLIWYWLSRSVREVFLREPDLHIGYIFWFLTLWEILSFPMLIVWVIIYINNHKKYAV